jgi:hypothetical protein
LSISEHGWSFHFLCLLQCFIIFIYRSFASLVNFLPRHFLFLWRLLNCDCFPDCFLYLCIIDKQKSYFCMLVLYPVTLPKVFIKSNKSFGESLGSFCYRIVYLVIWYFPLLFISLLLLSLEFIARAIKQVLCWIRVKRLESIFSFLHSEEMLSIQDSAGYRYVIYILDGVEVCSFYPSVFGFYYEGCWISSKTFTTYIEMFMWFLSFILLMCCIIFMI